MGEGGWAVRVTGQMIEMKLRIGIEIKAM